MHIEATDEAAHAMKHKGPSTRQLTKALNSNDEADLPSSRHIRWMAGELLKKQGHSITHKNLKRKVITIL
jgi:hypothetical protein